MIILFSKRNSKPEKEIIEILTNCGANYISDKTVLKGNLNFTVISLYKNSRLNLKKGIAIFTDDTHHFKNQLLPIGITCICEDCNKGALSLLGINRVPVISCGMNPKNTVTLSSIGKESVIMSLQRSITQISGKAIEPTDFKISFSKSYEPFSVMASATALLLSGIIPNEF